MRPMYRTEDATPAPAHGPRLAPATGLGGVAGNGRLTGLTAVALLLLLAAEGATIPFIGPLKEEHILIGMALLPPVLLKLASTGYRFTRYYTGNPPYVRKGPPALPLRLLAPGVVLTTAALFATGVAILLAGPPSSTLVFLHKASFIAWFALMAVHVLGHLLELPRLALPDWRRQGPAAARLAGGGTRLALLGTALAAGVALAAISVPLAGAWL